MKRVAILLTGLVILMLQSIAQNGEFVEIPDTAFLYALIDEGLDTNGDSLISVAEAEAVGKLDIMNRGITDLTGIEAFVMLDTLICDNNSIETLNLPLLPEMTFLSCGMNPFDSLDLSHNPGLLELWVQDGALSYLDLSNNVALNVLSIKDNNLSNLDLTNNVDLVWINAQRNNLTNLDVSANVNLEGMRCYNNSLESLDVSKNLKLKFLACEENPLLDTLDVSMNDSLEDLWCRFNSLTSLILPDSSALEHIECGGNYLGSVDVSGCPNLVYFVPYDNKITSLDLSNNPLLYWLSCEMNQLTSLDVSNNPELNILWCGDNLLTTLDLSQNSKIGSIPEEWNHLNLDNMPSLGQVCVWDGFPGDAVISSDGSPNVYFTTDCTIGFEENKHDKTSIYPNPTTDILTIETAGFGPHSIRIQALNGQEIYAASLSGTLHQIDLSFFRKGVYILHIQSDKRRATRKLIKL